jgi:hypothetical protein
VDGVGSRVTGLLGVDEGSVCSIRHVENDEQIRPPNMVAPQAIPRVRRAAESESCFGAQKNNLTDELQRLAIAHKSLLAHGRGNNNTVSLIDFCGQFPRVSSMGAVYG